MNKKHEAQQLYMNGCRTQKEIAEIVGVSERTVHTWIHQYAWDKLRLAAYHAPATIADNLCSQIVELQNTIARKEPGARYPTQQEAEIMRKLIVCLEKIKKTPSLSQNMQMLETFRNYVRPIDKDFAKKLSTYTNKFLNGKATNGYAPYQAEYGVELVPPVSHIYDEVPEAIPQKEEVCATHNQCLHKGNCTYPKCLHPERYTPPIDPITLYRTTPVLNTTSSQFDEELAATSCNFLAQQESPIEAVIPNEVPAMLGLVEGHGDEIVESHEVSGTVDAPSNRPGYIFSPSSRGGSLSDGGNVPATSQSKTAENATSAQPQNSFPATQ